MKLIMLEQYYKWLKLVKMPVKLRDKKHIKLLKKHNLIYLLNKTKLNK